MAFKLGDNVIIKASKMTGEITRLHNSYDWYWVTTHYGENAFHINEIELDPNTPIIGSIEATKVPRTLKEAFIQEAEAKKPKYDTLSKEWYEQGRCPKCGETGRYHLSTPICSTHGAY